TSATKSATVRAKGNKSRAISEAQSAILWETGGRWNSPRSSALPSLRKTSGVSMCPGSAVPRRRNGHARDCTGGRLRDLAGDRRARIVLRVLLDRLGCGRALQEFDQRERFVEPGRDA